jgi:hypothetical protein
MSRFGSPPRKSRTFTLDSASADPLIDVKVRLTAEEEADMFVLLTKIAGRIEKQWTP